MFHFLYSFVGFIRFEPPQFFHELEIKQGELWQGKERKIRLLAKSAYFGHPWFDAIAVKVARSSSVEATYAAQCLGFIELNRKPDAIQVAAVPVSSQPAPAPAPALAPAPAPAPAPVSCPSRSPLFLFPHSQFPDLRSRHPVLSLPLVARARCWPRGQIRLSGHRCDRVPALDGRDSNP